jgi:hypothetical protein
MAACCHRCQQTGKAIVDDGPDQCSAEFIVGPGGHWGFAAVLHAVPQHRVEAKRRWYRSTPTAGQRGADELDE